MVATSVAHYYQGPADVRAVAMTRINEWGYLLKKAALVVPLYWKLAEQLDFPIEQMLISIRGLGGSPDRSLNKSTHARVDEFCWKAAGVLCVSRELYDAWSEAHFHHVYIGHSAVDLRYWYPPTVPRSCRESPIIAGWTGNSRMKCKRVETFFMPAIKLSNSHAVPHIQCGREASSHFVERVPWERMAEQFYHKIDVLCITSSGEGTPNPLLEALACGVPVISTRVGHVPEVMTEENEFGWMINTPREMSECLIKLATCPHLRCTMREAAILKAREWSWENKIHEWKHAIDDTLKRLRRLKRF